MKLKTGKYDGVDIESLETGELESIARACCNSGSPFAAWEGVAVNAEIALRKKVETEEPLPPSPAEVALAEAAEGNEGEAGAEAEPEAEPGTKAGKKKGR